MNFSFLLTPPFPVPLTHSFSLTYAFFLCFFKMPSRCWQRVTAGRLCHCHAHHTHTWLQLCLRCAPLSPSSPPLPLTTHTPRQLYYYCYYYYFHHCLQHFRFALCVWSTSECIHTFAFSFAFAFIRTQTHIGKSLRNPSTRVSLSTREGRCITYSFLDCWLALFIRVIAWFGDLFVGQWMTCCLANI